MTRIIITFALLFPALIFAQQPIIINHNSIDLTQIPAQWIDSARLKLHIGYGHTSHGSQLTSGMDALESFYANGTFNWSHEGGPGELHLFEGSGYSSGYLELDCGYAGWDDETRDYLNDHPSCNVIIWSWCGQVNSVDLQNHYLGPMSQLESEYPDVQFVYMTGHLEGLGPDGSLFQANQQIRDYCNSNEKILFDFADIEKYDPDAEVNYQEYFCDDGCNYTPPGGGSANWANDWLAANPDHELTQISGLCSNCAHSVSLNCVKKGVACWFLWARLAGWEGSSVHIVEGGKDENLKIKVYPVPVMDHMNIYLSEEVFCRKMEILNMQGSLMYSKILHEKLQEFSLENINFPPGYFFVRLYTDKSIYNKKFILY